MPLLSVSIDFYVRVFVRVYTSPAQAKFSPTKLSYLYQCVGCESFKLQQLAREAPARGAGNQEPRFMPGVAPAVDPKCPECGWGWNMGGPYWTAPLYDKDWSKVSECTFGHTPPIAQQELHMEQVRSSTRCPSYCTSGTTSGRWPR